jgi:hypothetical protein
MRLEFAATQNPLPNRLSLALVQRSALFGRRHPLGVIAGHNPPPQFALVRLPGDQHRAALALLIRSQWYVQALIGLPLAGVRSMTREAMVRQNRPHITVELDWPLGANDGKREE